MRCISGTYAGRGILLTLIGAAGLAVFAKYPKGVGNGANLGMYLLCLVSALLYYLASCQGEPAPSSKPQEPKPHLLNAEQEFNGGDFTAHTDMKRDDEQWGASSPAGNSFADDDAGFGSNPFA